MKPRIIKNADDYEGALARAEELACLEPSESTVEDLEVLGVLLEDYERRHFPIPGPTPLDAIRFRMDQAGLRQKDLVPFIGTRSRVSEVLSGRRPLTLRMIRGLHEGLGIPASVLLASEPSSREPESLDATEWPVDEMARRGWFGCSVAEARLEPRACLDRFFASLGGFEEMSTMYRRSRHTRSAHKHDANALTAWTARVLQIAEKREYPRFEPECLSSPSFFETLRSVSWSEQGPKLAQEFLGRCGIALVVEAHLPKTYLDGAAFLSRSGRPVVALSARHDRLDSFWFTLFHELAHVAMHLSVKRPAFVDDMDALVQARDRTETEADRLAAKWLIPSTKWRRSAAFRERTPEAVVAFAEELNIHPAIVAGRIRREANNYRILTQLVGKGEVRRVFTEVHWH